MNIYRNILNRERLFDDSSREIMVDDQTVLFF